MHEGGSGSAAFTISANGPVLSRNTYMLTRNMKLLLRWFGIFLSLVLTALSPLYQSATFSRLKRRGSPLCVARKQPWNILDILSVLPQTLIDGLRLAR